MTFRLPDSEPNGQFKNFSAARHKGHPTKQAFRFMLSEAGNMIETHEHTGDFKEP
jgi:hypothetical protein